MLGVGGSLQGGDGLADGPESEAGGNFGRGCQEGEGAWGGCHEGGRGFESCLPHKLAKFFCLKRV
jgi:hypothetical protein